MGSMKNCGVPATTFSSPLRVAVIGAGPAGLAACRHLVAEPERFRFVCYEQCPSIGGAWYYAEDNVDYDQDNTVDENNDHYAESHKVTKASPYQSCMYKNLRTNSPTECFVFPDFPFQDEHFLPAEHYGQTEQLRSFVTHHEMLMYMRSYAKHFSFMPHIRLNTSVVDIRRAQPENSSGGAEDAVVSPRYALHAIDTVTGAPCRTEVYDAIMVCNGRYSKPKWPRIDNLEKFAGKLMHSKYYRHPKQFAASNIKKIVVMGGGYSGIDIAIDLDLKSKIRKQVILSVHDVYNVGDMEKWRADCKIQVRPDIVAVLGPNKLKFADGSTEDDVDAVLIGTGYCYDFPFLSEEDGLRLNTDDQCLTPLYKHIVHIKYPTIGFIGMTWTGLTIPQFHQQAKYFMQSLKGGSFQLPSSDKMLEWAEQDLERRMTEYKWPKRYAHKMGKQVLRDYFATLEEESGISPLDNRILFIDDEIVALRASDPVNFKLRNYRW